jgi:hypothetical protein
VYSSEIILCEFLGIYFLFKKGGIGGYDPKQSTTMCDTDHRVALKPCQEAGRKHFFIEIAPLPVPKVINWGGVFFMSIYARTGGILA